MSVILLNETIVHYESLGRGRPVLFLHTWVGSWRYWVSSLEAAAVSHSAYALDLLGFGDSARLRDSYSLEAQAGMIDDFLAEMGISRIALVAHGLGALVALTFANRHPNSVSRLLAIALPVDTNSDDPKLSRPDLEELLRLLGAPDSPAAGLLPSASSIDRAALDISPDRFRTEPGLRALQRSDIPVLLLYGAQDPLQRPPPAEQPPGLGTNFHQIVFPESGHFLMLDAPDTFQRLMMDFLALEQGTSPRQLGRKEVWRRIIR